MPDDLDRTLSDTPESARPLPDEDTELVAYLDGELQGEDAARVEARIASDPATRRAAEALRKSYDLLEYLPIAEPSVDFTARTVTRLRPALPPPEIVPAIRRPARYRMEALAWAAACGLVLLLGYLGHSATRTAPTPDEPSLDDLEIIERLSLYAGIDDLDFLRMLDSTDLFDDDTVLSVSTWQRAKIETADRTKAIAQFRELPATRQQQLRILHQELKAEQSKAAGSLFATLTGYASWLDRLPETDRRKILSAPGPNERLLEIRQVKEGQWRAALTPRQKELLRNVVSTADRESLAADFRNQQANRREEWELAHRQWQLVAEKGQKPWPFDDPKREAQVEAYIRDVLGADLSAAPPERAGPGPDPQPQCRLTRSQFQELKALHDSAIKDGGWSWMAYGAGLLRLADVHPSLPPPRTGKPVVNPETAPKEYKVVLGLMGFGPIPKGGPKPNWYNSLGRWPDFALVVHDFISRRPKGLAIPSLPPLGPSRPDEFPLEVAALIKGPLAAKVPNDMPAFRALEGRWPEYPRKLLELARKADLAVPGVTLPGEPSQWDRLYRLPPGRK